MNIGQSDSCFRLPSCGSVSAETARTKIVNKQPFEHNLQERFGNPPSRIFCSNSSRVGSISSHPSGGGFRLRRTFGIVYFQMTLFIFFFFAIKFVSFLSTIFVTFRMCDTSSIAKQTALMDACEDALRSALSNSGENRKPRDRSAPADFRRSAHSWPKSWRVLKLEYFCK